jgi:hypothetical protein
MRAELEALASEMQRTRDLFGAEREAMVREVEELQNRLEGLERAQDEAEYEHHQACAAWEEERQGLEAWSERQRQELLEAERRSSELRAQFEAERQAWDQRRDEHARRIAAGEARLREAEQLQGRTARDRDARAQDVERLHEQLAALERSRAAAEAERDEARAGWEAERQGLQEQGERRRRELLEDAERRLAELRAQFDAERQAWDQRAASGREHEPLQQETERARDLLDASRRERDAALQQVEAAGRERDLLHARIEEAEAGRREAERSGQAERDRLIAALEQARREFGAAAELGAKHAEEVRTLRAELERQRRDREVRDEEKEGSLAALRRDWEVERRRWLELLAAAHPEVLPDGPAPGNDRPSPPCGDSAERSATTQATVARPQGSGIEPITPTFRRTGGHGRPPRRRGAATPLRARPQASSYHDPETFRSHLEQWLAEAQARPQGMNAPPGRSGNEASSTWLEYEIRTAREEIALLEQSQVPGPKDPAGRSVVQLEPA